MSYIRVFYNAARDGMFTPAFSSWLANLSHQPIGFQARIALIWGCFVLVFSLVGTLSSAIAFTGVVLVLVYVLVAVAALVARKSYDKRWHSECPYGRFRPFWYSCVLIRTNLTQQPPTYLLITLGVIIITMLYYFLVLRP